VPARADVAAGAQANYDAAVAGPTREERAIADAQVQAAAAAVTVLERRLDKMVLHAPADGVVTVIAGGGRRECSRGPTDPEVRRRASNGSLQCARRSSQPSLDGRNGERDAERTRWRNQAVITELRPLGTFATWQAERGHWGS